MSEQLTGRALDRAIAEELGYTVEFIQNDEFPRGTFRLDIPLFSFYVPENHISRIATWQRADIAWSHVPQFHVSADVVLAICSGRGWALEFAPRKWVDMGYEALDIATVFVPNGDDCNVYEGHADSLQEAAARALLQALQAVRS